MSSMVQHAPFDAARMFTTHVFNCPCCRRETTVLSSRNFICLERTECQNCGRELVIENDVAHALTQ